MAEETADWKSRYASKVKSAESAVKAIKAGSRVYVGSACATPRRLTSALESIMPWPVDVELIHFLTTGMLTPDDSGRVKSRYRHRCFFVGMDMVDLVKRAGGVRADLASPSDAAH